MKMLLNGGNLMKFTKRIIFNCILVTISVLPLTSFASLINAQVKGTVIPMYAQISDPGVEFERGFFQADFTGNALTVQNIASGTITERKLLT